MTCRTCDGCLRVPFDGDAGLARYAPCWDCERGQSAMGIGPRFYGADLTHFPDLEHIRLWDGSPPGWLIYGDVGRGKSHLAAALCRQQAALGHTARFLSAINLLRLVKATFSEATEANARYELERYEQADMVVLDDLGAEHVTDWAEAELTRWIDGFYQRSAAMVVTTNLTLDELTARLGERISSRIAGMVQPLMLTGEDRRYQAATRFARRRVEPPPPPEPEPTPEQRERQRRVLREATARLQAGAALQPLGAPLRRHSRRAAEAYAVRAAEAALRPEWRAQIEALIREGREDQVPARWRRYVAEVKAGMPEPAGATP